MQQVLLLSPFNTQGNWGTEKLPNLPRVTQVVGAVGLISGALVFAIINDINTGITANSKSSWHDSLTIFSGHSKILELRGCFSVWFPSVFQVVSNHFHIVRKQWRSSNLGFTRKWYEYDRTSSVYIWTSTFTKNFHFLKLVFIRVSLES